MVKDIERVILASWLTGRCKADMNLFAPRDFEHYQELVRVLKSGETDPFKAAEKAKMSVTEIIEISNEYAPYIYETAVGSMCNTLARRWIAEHKDATIEEVLDGIKMFDRISMQTPDPCTRPAEELSEEFDARKTRPYVPTGLRDLDRMMNGIRRKELTVVGARPSVGKSAFVQQVAMNVAKSGHKVLFFPLEMSNISILERMFMRYADVSNREVMMGLSDEVRNDPKTQVALDKMREIFKDKNLLLFERCTDIQVMRKLIAKHKPYMIVIDQLEQVKDGSHHFPDKRSRFSHMTHELQGLAMDMDVAVWLACQVNRSADNSMPTMANLKESGTIEEDADNVILLHRVEEEKTAIQQIDLNLAKQRNGECGVIPLVFRAPKFAFYGREMLDE